LIPFAALHDDHQFMAERYSISTVTGLTMTDPSAARARKPIALLAGLSVPGPVVERLMAMGFAGSTELTASAKSRGLESPAVQSPPSGGAGSQSMNLRTELALPGVRTEIQDIVPMGRSHSLLDGDFTVARFTQEVQSGSYQVVHIASHGFFGRSSGQSFLLAYDDVIKLDDLQRLIAVQGAQSGIDLLTLSACDTATGDDRAPLGFAGAAIKAHARSVVGTLWAVSDTATQQFMEGFYKNLTQNGKAEALTRAQRLQIQSPRFSHPFYWAPFVLTGDWN
jgi:CHAT domain-containing protein